jgi:hypothetical protein
LPFGLMLLIHPALREWIPASAGMTKKGKWPLPSIAVFPGLAAPRGLVHCLGSC